MNLIVSGPMDESLINALVCLANPQEVLKLNVRAYRFLNVDDTPEARCNVWALCASARVDHTYLTPGTQFSKLKLLALDMDSTLITIECIDEIADFAGKKKLVAAITEATMRGELVDYSESLRRRVAMLAGTSADALRRVFDERLRLSKGAEELIQRARAIGTYVLLVSGGFDYFSERLKVSLSLDAAYANKLEVIDGKITGVLNGPLIDAAAKAKIVSETMEKLGCDRNTAMVIGDGANDVPMMHCVANAVAYHAKPPAREIASSAIVYGDLTTVLDFYSDA